MLRSTALALLFARTVLATPLIDLGLEAGAGLPVGPTASAFSVGGSGAVRAHVQLIGPLRAQLGAGFAILPSTQADLPAPGNAAWGGGGVRLVLFEGARGSLWRHAWFDAQFDVVGTGPVVRPGYEVGLGVLLAPAWPLGVGPYARFLHIVDVPGSTSADAFVLSVGVAVTLGTFPNAKPPPTIDPVARDADGDGVPDEKDACPDKPETFNNFEDADGCPDTPPVEATTRVEIKKKAARGDRDGDGLFDERDQCPDQAEVFNGVDDDDGCPDAPDALVELKGDRLELKRPVKLERSKGGWLVARASLPMLSAAAMVLSLHPEFRTVRVVARADQPSKDQGQRQAEAVRQALIDLGLDGARLVASAATEGAPRIELLLER